MKIEISRWRYGENPPWAVVMFHGDPFTIHTLDYMNGNVQEHHAMESIFYYALKEPGNRFALTAELNYPRSFCGPLPSEEFFFVKENRDQNSKAFTDWWEEQQKKITPKQKAFAKSESEREIAWRQHYEEQCREKCCWCNSSECEDKHHCHWT